MQLSYRSAAARQELAADVRPTALAVERYAEYLQSEAEELCLGLGLGATSTSATATAKALNGAEPLAAVATSGSTSTATQGAFRFWKTTGAKFQKS